MRRSTPSSPPPSKFPTKAAPTIAIDGAPMSAHSYLTNVQRTSAARARSSSLTSSLVSYSDSSILSEARRVRSGSSSAGDEPPERPQGWKGLNSVMPTPSSVSATRPPTSTYDTDFVPNPSDPYSLR